ncbi:MAG: DEAD/DEAH box helicase [Bacilli bacterium]
MTRLKGRAFNFFLLSLNSNNFISMEKFSDLKISKEILKALDDAVFKNLTPIQKDVFPIIRSGKDLIGIAQTGTGKTLAYLIPILMQLHYAQGNYPRAIIVVPTRELVLQVCESVDLLTPYMDIRCVGIYGGTNIKTQQANVFEGCDLLVATPGRYMDIFLSGILRTKQVKILVVDEADRLMDYGFIPQLNGILSSLPEKHQTMFFSATFSEKIEKLADSFLLNPIKIEVVRQATPVDNIEQIRYDVPNITTKVNLLKSLLSDKDRFTKVMVFTETKKNANRILEKLSDYWKDELSVIHSNKAQNSRINALKSFKEGKARILVSSDVAARGIDVKDVTHVINFDIPNNPEEYIHRIGRTGRAGKSGVAISLVAPKEIPYFEDIEELIDEKIGIKEIPDDVVISNLLIDEEIVQTANISYQKKGMPKGGGAFHKRSLKNSKTPQRKKRLDRTQEGRKKKR